MARITFSLAVPSDNTLKRVTRFSGWWLDDAKIHPGSLRLIVDGSPAAALQRVLWHELARALPEEPRAAAAGFVGDLMLPDDFEPGRDVDIAIEGRVGESRTTLFEQRYVVAEAAAPMGGPRIDLRAVLQHPEFGSVDLAPYRLGVDGARTTPVIAGVPHFHPRGDVPLVRLIDMAPTHKLGPIVEQLIADTQGMALDFGAGVPGPDRLRDNVVNLDLIHFPNVDVVSSYPNLPFRDNAFGLVFSMAVFEHLPNPRAAALEVARVLAPGGLFYIDVPFVAPLHGDPDHYFNMTMSGVREILRGFEILEIGIKGNHAPSVALREQVTAVLPLMRDGAWKQRLEVFLADLRASGSELDADLGRIGSETLAAGTYALARKL